ncbi:hypothetical protein [Hallella mizrahii]|mgnify:CR=1 FL=1|jgi:hypothetical protein|uniref:Uncharacterized protein n=1 Tax=Hallella mizrahii TaxID=2606637 RepID=A0A7K0KJI5_9BACT|nr:hypothetical protein [Hallella mizrahii]MST86002.1 hypothetical protein [Hallella mizrahii]
MVQRFAKVSSGSLDQGCIESAYSFFHQKYRVYEYSHSDGQKDDIEYAISNYVEQMNPSLYEYLSAGRKDYLLSHSSFSHDMEDAIDQLEKMLP